MAAQGCGAIWSGLVRGRGWCSVAQAMLDVWSRTSIG